jgi:hypothetical protein
MRAGTPPSGVWRFRELVLPAADLATVVSHPEGNTPLLERAALGAWAGPGPEWLGPLWFLLKALFVFLLVTWVRWSFVRIRVDQILALSWKLLLPSTLALLFATAAVVVWRSGGGL